MIKCPECKRLISAYIDGEVSENEKNKIEKHLEHCSDCLDDYRRTLAIVNGLKAIGDVDLPQDFDILLREKLVRTSGKGTNRVRLINTPRFKALTAVAACLIVVFLGRSILFDGIGFTKKGSFELSGVQESDSMAMLSRSAELHESDLAQPYDAFTDEGNENAGVLGISDQPYEHFKWDPDKTDDSAEEPRHLKVCIIVNSSSPEKHLTQLEYFAREEGAMFSEAEDSGNRLDFRINRENFTEIHEYLATNYGVENINYISRIEQEPSYDIDDLYIRYNELASRTTDARNGEDSSFEQIRLTAQKDLLMDMINDLEQERQSATVTIIFQAFE